MNCNRSTAPGPNWSGVFLAVMFLLGSAGTGKAQRFFSVVFEKLPQDFQLYPRDQNSEAAIPISGIVEAAGWDYVSVQITRNNAPFKYLKANLQYAGGSNIGKFSTETKIKAEHAGYNFAVYVCKGADSVLVVNRKDVVSGDVYIVSGQSNSTGFFTEPDTNRFCRTFGRITDNLNTVTYNPADTLWSYSNMNLYQNGVGTMGFEIQKQVMQKSGIPNCLINAGFHWSAVGDHAKRNENNPADLNTGYGRMLYRLQKGGLINAAKSYIFRQGETETYHEAFNWPGNFDQLHKNLKLDLPNLQKIYSFQIDIIYFPSPTGAEIRDYQRRLPDIYGDITTVATVGTAEFDGLHYGRSGNQQSGFELSRIILKDFYNSSDTSNILSPSLKKVFYKTPEKKQLVLVFDEGQELVYPTTYRTPSGVNLEMKDFFYLDWGSGMVTSGKAEANKILLELSGPQGAKSINYLPMYLPEGGPYYPFTGPYIKNSKGMRALTFYNVPIGTALAKPVLTAEKQGDTDVKLSWLAVPEASRYILERQLESTSAFTRIAVLDSVTTQFVDQPNHADKIRYRLRAENKLAESDEYGFAEIEMPVILGVEKDRGDAFSVYPNPTRRNDRLVVKFNKSVTGEISFLDVNGRALSAQAVKNATETVVTVPASVQGIHLIRLKAGEKEWTKKVWVQ